MNELNNSVFWEGIGWRVPVFQDGDYALTMDSASLSTCQMVVPFGNYQVLCHKLVLKSVSCPKIVKNTPILMEQSIACNVYTYHP